MDAGLVRTSVMTMELHNPHIRPWSGEASLLKLSVEESVMVAELHSPIIPTLIMWFGEATY